MSGGDHEQVWADTREQWRTWLSGHAASPGVWLVTWKKGRGAYLPYDEIVDEALRFGWIDSRPRTIDTDRMARLVAPRRPGSNWSQVNKERVRRLTAAGLMSPAGLAAVELAQQDGPWTALDEVEQLREPDDLREALDLDPRARTNWDGFPRSTRRAILEWISTAKTAPTRARRVRQTVDEAAVGRRANQWRQPRTG